jgi:putative membrane protein
MQEPVKMSEEQIAIKNILMSAKRTMMSAERTLMSWMRTSLALIGFGFTIFQFLQYLRERDVSLTLSPSGPRRIGIILMTLGIAALIVSCIEYLEVANFIAKEFKLKKRWFPLVLSFLIGLFGLALLISVIVNIRLV